MRPIVVAAFHALAARLAEWIYDGEPTVDVLPPWIDINESRVNVSYTLAARIEPTGLSSMRCDSLFVELQGEEEWYRVLAVTFRGTTTARDWIANAGALPDYDKFKSIGLGVHAGWKAASTFPEYVNRLRSAIIQEASGKGLDAILFTGHSLGGALAQVAALVAYTDHKLWEDPKASKLLSGLQCITVAAPQPFSPTSHQQIHTENGDAAAGVVLAQAQALQWMERRCTNYVRNNDLVPRLPGNLDFVQRLVDRVPWTVSKLLDLGGAPVDFRMLLKQDMGLGVYAPICTTRLLVPGGGYETIGRANAKKLLGHERPQDDSVPDTYYGVLEWGGLMAAHNEHSAKVYVNKIYRAVGAKDYAHGHHDSFDDVKQPLTGLEYAGQRRSGQYHGQGRLTYTDAAGKHEYEGHFIDGHYHGHGRLTLKSATGNTRKTMYVGEFARGHYHGPGTLTHACGEQSRGRFKDGELHHGHGILESSDGSWFLGHLVDGQYEGEGWLKEVSGKEYRGTFKQALFDGDGILEFPGGERYTGQFFRGQYHGQGRLTMPDGAQYVGEFAYDQFHGPGLLKHADGRQENGWFKDGKLFLGGISPPESQ